MKILREVPPLDLNWPLGSQWSWLSPTPSAMATRGGPASPSSKEWASMAKKRANGQRKVESKRWALRKINTLLDVIKAASESSKMCWQKLGGGKSQADLGHRGKPATGYLPLWGIHGVVEWMRLWFELYAKPNIRPSTVGYYLRGMEEYTIPRIGTTKLNKLTSREIQKLYKDLLENGQLRKKQRKKHPGLSGSTVRGVHIMLHSALDRAVKERLLIRNPADSCVVAKVQHQEMKTLQPENLKAYLDTAEKRGALAMFYPELGSSIRKGELVVLRWEDLDIPNKTISVSKQATNDEDNHLIVPPKTENSVRQISIPQEAVELLIQEHAKHPGNPWLFPSSRTGAMYHPDSVATLHQRILKDAGLEHLRFHDLRHAFATLALQNGVDIKTISAMLGHYDAGFTLRTYTHTTRQKQDEAAQTMGNLMAQVR